MTNNSKKVRPRTLPRDAGALRALKQSLDSEIRVAFEDFIDGCRERLAEEDVKAAIGADLRRLAGLIARVPGEQRAPTSTVNSAPANAATPATTKREAHEL